jgi:tripartite-type tricarboxylate transporter receptor subunit TctC
VPGFAADNWWGIMVAAGTPQPIVDRLYKEIGTVLTTQETQKRFASEGATVVQMSPAEFGAMIASETAKWGRVVREAKITGD